MANTVLKLYIILSTLLSCNSPAPNEAAETDRWKENPAPNTDEPKRDITSINGIRQEYQEIVKAIENKEFSSTSFEFDCHGERTGRVTFYLQDDKVRMVEKTYSEYSHRDATEQYFIANDQLFFLYFKVTDWVFDFDSEEDNATRDNIKENRYYLVNDSLVSCLEKNYIIRSASSENPKPEQVKNKAIACPPEEELLGQYQKLLGYKKEDGKIGCL